MSIKTRSYSKGLIDTKDKYDANLMSKELQQLSPNTSQTKYFPKDEAVHQDIQIKPNQSGTTQTHFQKYNNNIINSGFNKSYYGCNINISNSQNTSSAINHITNSSQQLKKQDSLKNISKSLKKPNLITPPQIKMDSSPLKKLDSLIKKKPVAISSNITTSKASISLAGSAAINSFNISNRMGQAKSVNSQEGQLNQQQLESSNLINIKLSQEALKLRRNDENLFSNLGSKLNSLPSSEFTSPDKCRIIQATQDTRDSTSNCSTIKGHKHSNSNTNHSDYTLKSSIKNPEDLHFFYVSTIQINKEFINKFDVDDK